MKVPSSALLYNVQSCHIYLSSVFRSVWTTTELLFVSVGCGDGLWVGDWGGSVSALVQDFVTGAVYLLSQGRQPSPSYYSDDWAVLLLDGAVTTVPPVILDLPYVFKPFPGHQNYVGRWMAGTDLTVIGFGAEASGRPRHLELRCRCYNALDAWFHLTTTSDVCRNAQVLPLHVVAFPGLERSSSAA
jgi:hypothetical protein